MFEAIHRGARPPVLAVESRTIGDMFIRRAERTPDAMAWMQKHGGQWVSATWREFFTGAASFATWLLDHGLQTGDKICIVGGTRPEWAIADLGGLLAGAVTVGAYPTLPPVQLAYIIAHSDSRIVVVEGRAEVEKLREIRDRIPHVDVVLVWDTTGIAGIGTDPWLVPFTVTVERNIDRPRIAARQAEINPNDTAIIVYTSGTTGPPKGAMITHANVLALLGGMGDALPFDSTDYGLSFLPMAHVAERVAACYGRISVGAGTAYATSIPAVLQEVLEVRPTLFGSVPRIFEKAYAKIMGTVQEASPTRQKIFRWAEGVGRRSVRLWQEGKPIPLGLRIRYRLADRLVFSKIRGAFGGRVKHFVTGAAPIAREILEFFWAAGFPIYEVYGMTEATVITHANMPGAVRLGSVGKPAPFVEDRIAEDGEILVRGPMVFKGYYKDPEATAEAIDAEGWLHTGDIGEKDKDGYLYIKDRKKHIIITAGGKNLTPANIENEIKTQDPLISHVHAHGDRRPYVTALLTIHSIEAVEFARKHGLLSDETLADRLTRELTENPLARPPELGPIVQQVSQHPEVRKRLTEAVRRGNRNLARVESVKKILILDREFSAEEDELTPTLKLKRKNVEAKFSALFDRLYSEPGFGIDIEKGGE